MASFQNVQAIYLLMLTGLARYRKLCNINFFLNRTAVEALNIAFKTISVCQAHSKLADR